MLVNFNGLTKVVTWPLEALRDDTPPGCGPPLLPCARHPDQSLDRPPQCPLESLSQGQGLAGTYWADVGGNVNCDNFALFRVDANVRCCDLADGL